MISKCAQPPYDLAERPPGPHKPFKALRRIPVEATFTEQQIYDAAARMTAVKRNLAGAMQNLPAVQRCDQHQTSVNAAGLCTL